MPKEVEELFNNGPVVLPREKYLDHRGSFEMIFEDSAVREIYPEFPKLLQVNALWANYGAIRGVHAAAKRENHWKVVTCVFGSVREAVVDLRTGSASFGEMRSLDISELEPSTLVIPPGFGHAVQSLSQRSLVVYGTNVEYENNREFEINPMDEKWIEYWNEPIILSERDRLAPSLNEFLRSSSPIKEI